MNRYSAGKTNRIIFLISLLLTFYLPALFSNPSEPDTAKNSPTENSREDLVRGERLFYGLVYSEEKSVNCTGCHNTNFIDSVNWNPDAFDISAKYKDKSVKDLTSALLRPRSAKMMEVHKGFDLNETDIRQIKAFMDEFAAKGLKPQKNTVTNRFFFIVISLLFLFSLVDITIIKKFRYKWLHLVILLGGGIYITNSLVKDALAIGRSQNYSPDQPIKFSHKVHAGQNGTNCLYCHTGAESSKSAGIPSTSVCMNCHLIVRNGTRSGAFEIAKIVKAYESGTPVNWIRVHSLPDHVYFNHSQHVSVAKLACQECHGKVQEMDRITQTGDLSMGWCINCHRTRKVDFHDNKFYQTYREKAEKMNKGEIDSVTVEMIGGTECMKCHY
jgi:hypothetical protein